MLKIVDLKVSNIASVTKVFEHLKVPFEVIEKPQGLENASKILLPGVGSFSNAADKLNKTGFLSAIPDKVITENLPILGICVGMQLLADCGEEGGNCKGLGLVSGQVKRLSQGNPSIRIPHVGWNSLEKMHHRTQLLNDINSNSCFYFVHSYHFKVDDRLAKVVKCIHGDSFTAYVEKGNIFGAQFHPEKSQIDGLNFLKAFILLC